MTAIVSFSGKADWPPLRFLKRGFRHCFVFIRQPNGLWIYFDPMLHVSELRIMTECELEEWVSAFGAEYTMVRADVSVPLPMPSVPVLLTCVSQIKRALGIVDCRIITPWQLFRFLKDKNGKQEK